MTFLLDALRDKPVGLFLADDTSPLQDYSSYSRTATISGGTPVQHAALVKGAAWAPVFTTTITAAFASNVFKQGDEEKPFTLGVWARVVSSDSNEQQLLGNSGQMDGITIKGTVVSFVTKYTANGEARCTYDMQQQHAVQVFGVHTETKNSLYVDGVLVDEVILSEEQQADTYASTSSNLICGTTSGTAKVAVNGIAFYATPLTEDSISRQFTMGRKLPDAETVVQNTFGDYIQLSLDNANLFFDEWVTSEEDWNTGFFDNASVVQDQLIPTFTVDTSNAGRWYTSLNIDASGVTSIYGVQFNWDGVGATVEVSLDGTTWESVTRGKNCTTIPPGTDPTNQTLQIRISFPGGIVDDESYVDNLNIIGLTTAGSNTIQGRTMTYTGAHPEREHKPTEYHDNWGIAR